mmetsp:Transcript_12783/g.44411  ORF Transcript_12783/g.44411 Transcript_12783/m.44411 type:complete len:1137 (-) Transcript_12783:29-3439(-)
MSGPEAGTTVYFATAMVISASLYLFVLATTPTSRPGQVFKEAFAMHLRRMWLGQVLEILQAVASLGSCILFVLESYWEDEPPIIFFRLELVFCSLFICHYFTYLYLADIRYQYVFFDFFAIIDAVTVVPVIVIYASGGSSFSGNSLGFLRFARIVKFARVLRLLRIFRSLDYLSEMSASVAMSNAIFRQTIVLTTTILSLIVVCAGLVQFMANDICSGEDEEECASNWNLTSRMQFHDALYFTIVTFTTVGYGDISPGNDAGRLFCLVVICVAFIVVPAECNKLLELIAMQPKYGGRFKKDSKQAHIVLLADEKCSGVNGFLQEFFHEDHGHCDTKVIVLSPGTPDPKLNNILLQRGGKGRKARIQYLQGDAIVAEDLLRARVDVAQSCFILTNKYSPDNDLEDSRTVLRAVAVKNFKPDLPTYAQVIEPENKVHLMAAGVAADGALATDELSLNLVALNVACPGFSTLLANLVSSSALSSSASAAGSPWHKEYAEGMTQEIYTLPLLEHFQGLTFAHAAVEIFRRSGACLIAIGHKRTLTDPSKGSIAVCLNPSKHITLRDGDVGYLIASDSRQLEELLSPEHAVNRQKATVLGRYRRKLTKAWYAFLGRQSPVVNALEPSPSMSDEQSKLYVSKRASFTNFGTTKILAAVPALDASGTKDTMNDSFNSQTSPSEGFATTTRLIGEHELSDDKRVELTPLPPLKPKPARAPEALSTITPDSVGEVERQPGNQAPVEELLREVGASDCCERFRAERVTMESLALMSEADFAELGVKVGPRKLLHERVTAMDRKPTSRSPRKSLSNETLKLYGDIPELGGVIVETVVGRFPDRHYLILTETADDLYYLLAPLRAPHSERRPIVLLLKEQPTVEEWHEVCWFPDVYFVLGNSLDPDDLSRAGVQTAHTICVLVDETVSEDFTAVDARVILTVMGVKSIVALQESLDENYRPPTLITELYHTTFARHLRPPETLSFVDNPASLMLHMFEPSYASGLVMSATWLENLLAQAYFNDAILQVIKKLVAGHESTDVIASLEKSLPKNNESRSAYPTRIALDDRWAGQPYLRLFEHLMLGGDMVPIGLCRPSGHLEAPVPFVFTNPSAETRVVRGDQVFVLCGGVHDVDDFKASTAPVDSMPAP